MVQIHPPLPLKMIKEDIKQLLVPLIEKSGCELWGLEISTQQGKGKVLRIYIDAIQGVNLDDCEKVSKEIDYFFQFFRLFLCQFLQLNFQSPRYELYFLLLILFEREYLEYQSSHLLTKKNIGLFHQQLLEFFSFFV